MTTKLFEQGALFALTDHGALLLLVSADFDVMQRTLDASPLGKSSRFKALHEAPLNEAVATDRARVWSITDHHSYSYAFQNFFRPFKAPDEVRNKPSFERLLLIPVTPDMPLIPNDLGDL